MFELNQVFSEFSWNVTRYHGISDSEVLGVGGAPSVSAEYPQVGLTM